MKESPIIFNTDMVRALLDGRKTQTRRPMAVQPKSHDHLDFNAPWRTKAPEYFHHGDSEWACKYCGEGVTHTGKSIYKCPFGQPGDQLWVRETTEQLIIGDWSVPTFSADGAWIPEEHRWDTAKWWYSKPKCPSIHMPRWASRITLEITGVRVERVQDISEEDADAECFGGDFPTSVLPDLFPGEPEQWGHLSLQECYGRLWNSLYGNWNDNPWVWVIEFKRIDGVNQ